MRILIADDDRQMSELCCAIVRDAGHTPIPSFDGASALMAAMRAPQPDLIILDLKMRAGTGQTTLGKLKASSRTTMIPVIIVAAMKDQARQDEVKALGATAFLEMPITPATLVAAIEARGPKG
ncbi:MAG: response regulator [Gemmatimonadota bacterium]|nr:response regulator [Gemmatimonadota bacterium]